MRAIHLGRGLGRRAEGKEKGVRKAGDQKEREKGGNERKGM